MPPADSGKCAYHWTTTPAWRTAGVMALLRAGAAALLVAVAGPVHAQISADRPGVGVGPGVLPPWTLQGEIGSDGQELRLGIARGVELDGQRGGGDSAGGIKLALADGPAFKAALHLVYDRQLHAVIEVPANITVNSWFNLGTDVLWSKSSRVYAAGFNFQPTNRLTITPTAYVDTRPRAAIFAAWIPRGHGTMQFDVGYDRRRVSVGVSLAFGMARLAARRRGGWGIARP